MDDDKKKKIAETMEPVDPSKVREKNPHNVIALADEIIQQKKKKQAMMDDLFPLEKGKSK